MTHKEKLKAVTEEIRSKLPRLMELEKGCLIKCREGNYYKIVQIHDTYLDVLNCRLNVIIHPKWDLRKETHLKSFLSAYKIIGQEPMLNDVLEWISIDGIRIVMIDEFGSFHVYDSRAKKKELTSIAGLGWNLSKPYLKDQSIELINFLYELL